MVVGGLVSEWKPPQPVAATAASPAPLLAPGPVSAVAALVPATRNANVIAATAKSFLFIDSPSWKGEPPAPGRRFTANQTPGGLT
ncbi:hypothetical protein [Fodinicola feengrottensis]|uniref:hypothetical protein n=1 Tax=Fodinicola feengrottensis TaxID=435914 RepID=UPI00244240B1|nr:hypothetical protein [Fodinicola feengrottensis]